MSLIIHKISITSNVTVESNFSNFPIFKVSVIALIIATDRQRWEAESCGNTLRISTFGVFFTSRTYRYSSNVSVSQTRERMSGL